MLFNEPNPYMFKGAGGVGVVSDEFSFLDSSVSELSAQGNGGMRQMYNYVSLDTTPETISTQLQFDPDKQPKLNMTLEQLENQRKNI
jgi:hypothetical protein